MIDHDYGRYYQMLQKVSECVVVLLDEVPISHLRFAYIFYYLLFLFPPIPLLFSHRVYAFPVYAANVHVLPYDSALNAWHAY